MKAALLLVPLLALSACARPDPQAEARTKALEARVAQLESKLAALQAAVQRVQAQSAGSSGDAQQVAARAAAQYCATQLASGLEEYRQDNARFPAMPAVSLPKACDGFRVAWSRLDKAHYRFGVSGPNGPELAGETR
jgi:hypothetical protein